MEGRVIGQYRVTGVLGEGGMGIVYAAEHTLLDRPAAVKVLLPKLSSEQAIVTRFFNEARAATAIRHPGIVEVYDFGWTSDGAAFIVMEQLQGETLRARSKRGPLRWSTSLALVRQVAGALAAAHAKSIVHRDLKPDNIFLVPDAEVPGGERIKLLDFGIAKIAGSVPNRHKTQTGTMMGTPTYMAPEQCRGVAVDARADLYALGCILFELCTGRPPFIGEGEGDVLVAHIHERPPTIASLAKGVPQEIDSLVQRLLAKRPADRVQTADEIIRLIDAAKAAIGQLARSGAHPILAPLVSPDGGERDPDSSTSAAHHDPKPEGAGASPTLPERSASRHARRDAVTPAPRAEAGVTAPAPPAMPISPRPDTTLSSATGALQRTEMLTRKKPWAVIGVAGVLATAAAVSIGLSQGGGNDQAPVQVAASSAPTVTPLPAPTVTPLPPTEAAPSPPPVVETSPPPPAPSAPEPRPKTPPVPGVRAPPSPPAGNDTRAPARPSSSRATEVPISIESTPAGAEIYLGNVAMGTTPRTFTLARGDYQFKAELRLVGYQTYRFVIRTTGPMKTTVTLKPLTPSSSPSSSASSSPSSSAKSPPSKQPASPSVPSAPPAPAPAPPPSAPAESVTAPPSSPPPTAPVGPTAPPPTAPPPPQPSSPPASPAAPS